MSGGRPRLEPGEIVTGWVTTLGPEEGKARPLVLVERRPGRWSVMLITTMPEHPRYGARRPVPNGATMGLHHDSYLWAPSLVEVPTEALGVHVGWASDELVDAIAELTGRSAWQLEELRPHARADRRRRARLRAA